MSGTIDVITLGPERVIHTFDQSPPHVRISKKRYGHTVYVDPCPAYAHDRILTVRMLKQVAKKFPIEWPVYIWLLPVECVSRTNGATSVDVDYDGPQDEDGKYTSIFGDIYFSAKRIPPHPAMTRYLVAHEYAHVVEEYLNKLLYTGTNLHSGKLLKDYAEMRGVEFPDAYGAGRWHVSPGEVFANDFRLLVCGVETEFWPHHGIERPEGLKDVRDWWEQRIHDRLGVDKAAA